MSNSKNEKNQKIVYSYEALHEKPEMDIVLQILKLSTREGFKKRISFSQCMNLCMGCNFTKLIWKFFVTGEYYANRFIPDFFLPG